MGLVLKNRTSPTCSLFEVDALADTGSVHLCIPAGHVQLQLGLEEIDRKGSGRSRTGAASLSPTLARWSCASKTASASAAPWCWEIRFCSAHPDGGHGFGRPPENADGGRQPVQPEHRHFRGQRRCPCPSRRTGHRDRAIRDARPSGGRRRRPAFPRRRPCWGTRHIRLLSTWGRSSCPCCCTSWNSGLHVSILGFGTMTVGSDRFASMGSLGASKPRA